MYSVATFETDQPSGAVAWSVKLKRLTVNLPRPKSDRENGYVSR